MGRSKMFDFGNLVKGLGLLFERVIIIAFYSGVFVLFWFFNIQFHGSYAISGIWELVVVHFIWHVLFRAWAVADAIQTSVERRTRIFLAFFSFRNLINVEIDRPSVRFQHFWSIFLVYSIPGLIASEAIVFSFIRPDYALVYLLVFFPVSWVWAWIFKRLCYSDEPRTIDNNLSGFANMLRHKLYEDALDKTIPNRRRKDKREEEKRQREKRREEKKQQREQQKKENREKRNRRRPKNLPKSPY